MCAGFVLFVLFLKLFFFLNLERKAAILLSLVASCERLVKVLLGNKKTPMHKLLLILKKKKKKKILKKIKKKLF